ncbi:hypothetical protein [Motilimonas cestriensis]|uniref:hypothetical protein n=1 Tax=Motilimonas cestriensis TaxID=2742685 RepID=UPI003DA4760E
MHHEYLLTCRGEIAKGLERGEVKFALVDELKISESKADKLVSGNKVVLQRALELEKLQASQQKLRQLGLLTEVTFAPNGGLLSPFMRDKNSLEDTVLKKVFQAELNFEHASFKRFIFNRAASFQISPATLSSATERIFHRKTAGFSEAAGALLAMVSGYFVMQHGLKAQFMTTLPHGLATALGVFCLFGLMLFINALLSANQVYSAKLPARLWCRSLFFHSPLQLAYQVYDEHGDVLGQIRHLRGAKIWCFYDDSGVELYRCEYEWGTEEKAGNLATEMRDDLMDFDYFDHLAGIGKKMLGWFGLRINQDTDSNAAWVTRNMDGDKLGSWSLDGEAVKIQAGCHNQNELNIVLFLQLLMAGKNA